MQLVDHNPMTVLAPPGYQSYLSRNWPEEDDPPRGPNRLMHDFHVDELNGMLTLAFNFLRILRCTGWWCSPI